MFPSDQLGFISYFKTLQEDAAATNRKNGFVEQEALIDELDKFLQTKVPSEKYDKFGCLIQMFKDARLGLKLDLIHGELGELLEAYRKGQNDEPDDHCPGFTKAECEAADIMLRLMNLATDKNWKLASAIVAKNEYNRNRFDHSKESRAQKHGKRF